MNEKDLLIARAIAEGDKELVKLAKDHVKLHENYKKTLAEFKSIKEEYQKENRSFLEKLESWFKDKDKKK